jgi:hypothetical protein
VIVAEEIEARVLRVVEEMNGRSKATANNVRVEYDIHELTGRVVPGEGGSSSRVGHSIF